MMSRKANESLFPASSMCRLQTANWFIFSRIKKGEGQGKEKCHTKSMMSKEANERLKRDTKDGPLRQNTEEKVREKGSKPV